MDDHVSKLEHMGKETVKKLQDIHTAAQQAGIEISVPDNCINKVGEFRKLAQMADADGHLRQKLQQVGGCKGVWWLGRGGRLVRQLFKM